MAQLEQISVRNRLLGALAPVDFGRLAPSLKPTPLILGETLIAAHRPIDHATFIEQGVVSLVADTDAGRIEIGFVGREGLVGTPLVLGTDRTPHAAMVQVEGTGLRITASVLREALDASSALRDVLGRYVQGLIVQIGQTVYANTDFPVEARLTHDRLGRDELPLTHEFLSIMLGVRRPSVTTAIHVLEGAGVILAKRGRVIVRDREKLQDLAGDSYGPAEAEYERLLAEI